ncbi:hypothetical protein GQ600_19206 [Phytophthora cactorum]|nr:hypothetical protein GQ600_19206 [Phytophthora cactorum]
MKNAEFVNLLYKNATPTERTCSFCDRVVKQKKQTGYKNLITHLQGFHNGYETVAEECVKKNCQPLSSMFVHKDAADTYGWTKLVALKNFPFTHVDDPISRSAIRYKAMDRATLLKRMVALVGVVDTNSAEEPAGEKFALGQRFLACLTVSGRKLDDCCCEHIDFLDMVLSQYGLRGVDQSPSSSTRKWIPAPNCEAAITVCYVALQLDDGDDSNKDNKIAGFRLNSTKNEILRHIPLYVATYDKFSNESTKKHELM